MHRIVILGAGVGGSVLANHLAEHLKEEIASGAVGITLLTDNPEHTYKPGFLYVAFGKDEARVFRRPVRELLNPLVTLETETVTGVDTKTRHVHTQSGRRFAFDQLVLATGARVLPQATPGLAERGNWFYTLEGALALRQKIDQIEGGRVVVSVIGIPHMCPVAPLEVTLILEDLLRLRGMREKVEILYTYPINRVHSIPSVAEWAAKEFESRGIRSETFFNADHVDPEKNVLASLEGTEIPFDLLIAIPEHRSASYLEDSGLAKGGWVATDRGTLAVNGQEGIWALGDTTDLPVSKAGSVAHYQAFVLARNVVCTFRGRKPAFQYDGKTMCFIETGLDSATFIEFSYLRPPRPQRPSKMIHWAKLVYNNTYWLNVRGVF